MNKSQWQISNRFIAILAIPFGLSFLVTLLLPMLSGGEKLQGNRLALSHCRWTVKAWKSASLNNTNFDFFKLSQDDKQSAAVMIGFNLDSLIKTNFTWGSVSHREPIIVCQKTFSNVHKPGFWSSFAPNPAHAVAYSDGTTELLSPEEFTNLNLSGFVSLSKLATNSEFAFFK